jgi:flagellin
MKGLAVGAENLQAAESLIRDTDMASQMVEFVKDRILVQSSTAMLAQANTKPQTVLQLFR